MTPFRRRLLALLTVLSVLLTACGGDDDTESGSDDTTEGEGGVRDDTGEEPAEEGEPQHGGTITIGLEAESNRQLPGETTPANAGLSEMVPTPAPIVVRPEDRELKP